MRILGILNVTPNSFSDGGKFLKTEDALAHAAKLIEDGADIIDVGAESTAPGVSPITPEEEWRRLEEVLPEVVTVAHCAKIKVSIDTRHAKTAELALQYGVDIINDQGGLLDPKMVSVAAKNNNVKIIIMHHFGIPVSQGTFPIRDPEELVREIVDWLLARAQVLNENGVDSGRIILDPGIGFGKTPEHSWHIIKNIGIFTDLGFDICVGHSRKSMFSVAGVKLEDRDPATAIVTSYLAQKGVKYIRVHDVPMTKTALEIAGRLRGTAV